MENEMVERVAKAIRDANSDTPVGSTFTELSEAMARAAIEAMREPTPGITRAWLDFYGVSGEPETLIKRARYIWQDMIRAALSPSPQPVEGDDR